MQSAPASSWGLLNISEEGSEPLPAGRRRYYPIDY